MDSGHLRLVAFGAACAFPSALAFVVTGEGLGDALIAAGSVGLSLGVLVLQTRAAILAMRTNRGSAAPVARTTGLIWAGAVPVFFAVLVVGKWLGAFDELNRVGPWDWGPHLALFLTESLVSYGVVTGVIVIAVVAVVQRVRRRRARGETPAATLAGS
jgi:hypothetical protein